MGERQLRRDNHYVPVWYQRGFLMPGQGEAFVLDKGPDLWIDCGDGIRRKVEKRVRPRGPLRFLRLTDLYTTTLLGELNDEIESLLFGRIDDQGAKAVQLLCAWPDNVHANPDQVPMQFGSPNELIQGLVEYIDAQKLRTPKGLAWIKHYYAKRSKGELNQNRLMFLMQKIRNYYYTPWFEGFWEIVSAEDSEVKFIYSDDPICLYNMARFPGSAQCVFPLDPHPLEVGTRTIFPLNKDFCLIISNVEHARDPKKASATKARRNARLYDEVYFTYLDIQKNRRLNSEQVAAINFVVKSRAVQYVAAANPDWLYPENFIRQKHWPNFDGVLQHDGFAWKLSGGDVVVQYSDKSLFFTNEYGEHETVPAWFVREQEKKRQR